MKLLLFVLLLAIVAKALQHRVRLRHRQRETHLLGAMNAFIARAADFDGAHVDRVVAALGPWTAADDWDWGRIAYEWRHPELRLRVLTQSQHVHVIELLDPRDCSRFGPVLETLLDTSGNDERAASPGP